MSRIRLLLALLLATSLFAFACGSDDGGPSVSGDAIADGSSSTNPGDAPDGFPVTIETPTGELTLESSPQRILSLSSAATEILFAIGAGDQVVAVDSFSTFPPDAPTTDLSAFEPNVEAITAFEPDLVVIFFDANELAASLADLDIPVLLQPAPADLDGMYDQIAQLGVATGQIDGAATTVAALRSEIEAAIAAAPSAPVRIYHEVDENFFSASSGDFVGAVYAALGATNIADEVDGAQFGFPQLSEEFIIEADPELIVITDQVGYTPDDVARRPGWDQISAVQNGNIVVVDADTASRSTPRIVEFIEAVAEALAAVESANAA